MGYTVVKFDKADSKKVVRCEACQVDLKAKSRFAHNKGARHLKRVKELEEEKIESEVEVPEPVEVEVPEPVEVEVPEPIVPVVPEPIVPVVPEPEPVKPVVMKPVKPVKSEVKYITFDDHQASTNKLLNKLENLTELIGKIKEKAEPKKPTPPPPEPEREGIKEVKTRVVFKRGKRKGGY